ncbi:MULTISPECIES: PDDEXK family nuclease [Haloarcula]|uniref:Restriction endonuclease n=1 Tax=Haloarcula marismortui (strain ATCC 43049 / DSM 3752 / JCM 8966 / VKM B-1809) TaxID=272569 RepID=Q5V7Q7_HALMA|nr:hypothetical protein [Haloarcula marismortui]AAV44518.1 unknown [Haloarcula marismortui ATCC 43049]QCP89639.1 hypothetical protein E6P14_01640 [Haloarcula marismortui ATCC 43049]
MTTDTEIALLRIQPDTLEQLASDVLSAYGYDVNPSGTQGTDAGRDAYVTIGGQAGIAHYSKQKTWRQKLRKDASKAGDHEREYEIFVFVTNQEVTGQQEMDMREEVREEYDWELDLWHLERLRNKLETDLPEIAQRHLGVDPQGRPDSIEAIEDLKQSRIEAIIDREEIPVNLEDGPFVAIHLLPNGMESMEYGVPPSELPTPPKFGDEEAPFDGDPIDIGKTFVRERGADEHRDYTFIHEDGWIEAVSTYFVGHDGTFPAHKFDTEVVKTVRGSLKCLKEIGAKPPIFAYLTVHGFKDVEMWYEKRVHGPQDAKIPRETMSLTRAEITAFDESTPQALKPVLDRFWNGCGWSVGCIDYSDGEWDPYYKGR